MDVTEELRLAAERLLLLEAMTTAVGRRKDLLRIVGRSATADEAKGLLQAEWGVSEAQAVCVSDLQIRRFSATERSRIVDERAKLELRIAELEG